MDIYYIYMDIYILISIHMAIHYKKKTSVVPRMFCIFPRVHVLKMLTHRRTQCFLQFRLGKWACHKETDPWIPPILMYHHFPCKFTMIWPILRSIFCEAQNWEAVARLQQTQERDHQECKPGMPQGNDPIWPHGFMKVFAFEQNPDDAISIFTPICIYIVYIYIYICMYACMNA